MSNASTFLSKGSLVLGIAAYSRSRKCACSGVLGPALRHPVEQILKEIDTPHTVRPLAKAVMMATRYEMATSIPMVAKTVVETPLLLSFIGDRINVNWRGGNSESFPSGEAGGIVAMAVAWCRNLDEIEAIAQLFDDERKTKFRDIAIVAGTLVQPGVPSGVRRKIKQLVEMYQQGNGTRGINWGD